MMSMQCECWVNDSVPSDLTLLAKILGYKEEDVNTALTNNVMQFFYEENDKIICPELEAYRLRLDEARRKQIEGGREGQRRKKEKEVTSSYPQGMPEGSLVERNLTENNLLEHKITKPVFRKRELPAENNLEKHKDFIEDMENSDNYFK
jgi:hypothetical protein